MNKTDNYPNKENYYKILQLYTSSDKELPKYNFWMKKPFLINNNYAMATNSIIMAWFDKNLTVALNELDDYNVSENILTIINKEENKDFVINISDIKNALYRHEVLKDAVFNNKQKITLDSFYIDIFDCRISASVINTLIITADILNETKIVLKHQTIHNRPCLFKIGNINTLVLPCLKSTDQIVILKLM